MLEDARSAILEKIHSTEKITLISHYNPDADAYGSMLGLAASLTAHGKSITVVNETGILPRYSVIPGLHAVVKEIPDTPALLIACDCGSLQRIGDGLVASAKTAGCIINIDHHISNDMFGAVNYVDAQASSTSEIMHDLLSAGSYPINKQVAICLLAGIIGDTGSFRYTCTTAKTMRIAAELMDLGASPTELYTHIFASTSLGATKLQAESILNLELSCGDQFAEVIVTEEMVKKHGASFDDTDGLAERVRDIAGVKISASLRQDGSIWRVSLRSVNPKYNVSNIAAVFGGGGHIQAAAFRSSKPLKIIRENLQKKVMEALS